MPRKSGPTPHSIPRADRLFWGSLRSATISYLGQLSFESQEPIFEDRNFETQAAIAQIMKVNGRSGPEDIVTLRKRGVLDIGDIETIIDR
jgi:hypothetical protein